MVKALEGFGNGSGLNERALPQTTAWHHLGECVCHGRFQVGSCIRLAFFG